MLNKFKRFSSIIFILIGSFLTFSIAHAQETVKVTAVGEKKYQEYARSYYLSFHLALVPFWIPTAV